MLSSISPCTTAQSVSRLQQTAANSSGASTTQTATDTVSISEESRTASLLDGRLDAMGITRNSEGEITINSLAECIQNDTAHIEKQLQTLYRQLGISSDSEMTIDIGPNGKAIVSGESPAAEELAEAINEDPELLNTMKRASGNAAFLAAYEEAIAFQAAYKDDPYAAVERYGYLLNDNREHNAIFRMNDGALDVNVKIGYSFASSAM